MSGVSGRKHSFDAGSLRQHWFKAKSIIDVGVDRGTPEMYEAFADRHFVLVEPQPGGMEKLLHKPRSYIYKNVALGAAPGKAILQASGPKSSLLDRTALTLGKNPISQRHEVEIVTLDDLITSLGLATPIGLKIDTEGFELEILKGLSRCAEHVEFMVCEVSIRRRFVGGYLFAELVSLARRKGLEFLNFLNQQELRPRYYDCLFVRHDHPLLD